MIPRACIRRGPDCSDNGLALPGGSRCRAHAYGWDRKRNKAARDANYTGTWPALRKRVLSEEPTCRLRLPACSIVATEVDHIRNVGEGGGNDRSNLQPVCSPCHRKKTHAESNASKRRRQK